MSDWGDPGEAWDSIAPGKDDMSAETVRDLRERLQAMAEDYQDLHAENGDLRRENARLQGQIEVLREQWDRLPLTTHREREA